MILSNGTEVTFTIEGKDILLEIRDPDEYGTWVMQPMTRQEAEVLHAGLRQVLENENQLSLEKRARCGPLSQEGCLHDCVD